jgi:hypothetical protein
MNKKKLKFLLVILPVVFLVLGLSFERTKYSTDPESAYLINGLNVDMGKQVGLYHHPGATVQLYCAIVIPVTHFFRFTENDLQTDVLLNTEYYIEVLRFGLMAINTVVLFLLGLTAFLWLQSMWLAILLQLTPFLSATVLELAFTKVSPEPVILTTVMLLIILALKYYTSLNQKNRWFPVLFGVICGFGLASRITFIPLLVIPFMIIRGRWNKALFLSSIPPAFVLFTLPLIPVYRAMYYWFRDIGTHTGDYGQGNAGLINTNHYMNSIFTIARNNVELISVMIVSCVLLLIILITPKLHKRFSQKPELKFILAILLAQAGTMLLVAKQFSNHYLVGALCLTGVMLVFIFLYIHSMIPETWKSKHAYSIPLLAIVFMGFALLNIPYLSLAFKGYRLSNQSTDETMALIGRDYPGYAKTYYYPVSFNEFSQLRWGNIYAQRAHTDALVRLLPKGLFYNVWEKSFQLWETNIPPLKFLKEYGGRILLIGGPRTSEELKMVEDGGLKLTKLSESRLQVVYEIDTAKSFLFQDILHPAAPAWILENDFEEISKDKQWIMSEGEPFCKNISLTKEKARSGLYSFSLPKKETYAMEYILKNLVPGASYHASIWRLGGDDDASLVVSSQNADLVYAKSKGMAEKDAKGWMKVALSFKIPKDFKEDHLKIYLWNNGTKPAWFDDFEIKRYK